MSLISPAPHTFARRAAAFGVVPAPGSAVPVGPRDDVAAGAVDCCVALPGALAEVVEAESVVIALVP